MKAVFLGLSITSSWGNGHATTYRALVRALAARGHSVSFLERDVPWYAGNRDLPEASYCRVCLYGSLAELEDRHAADIRDADLVVLGSYVPEGSAVADLVLRTARGCTAFYDIDTPVTLAALGRGAVTGYLERRHVPRFDLYLSFAGGPTLDRLERELGARAARPLYCSVDPDVHFDAGQAEKTRDLGYLGTYSEDRQEGLARLLLEPAAAWPSGRFVIAGPQYPASMACPVNVARVDHVAPPDHREFYGRLRFTLNLTRRDMAEAGHAPSVRLFEAAACGTPIISDPWAGLEEVLTPGAEILIARTSAEVLEYLRDLPERAREELRQRARDRVLGSHTAARRAAELEGYVADVFRAEGQPARPAAIERTA